jgi:heat shock protein HslJ
MSEEERYEATIEGEQSEEQVAMGTALESVEQPSEKKRMGWPTAVIAVAAILLLCCAMVVCITAAIAAFSGGEQAMPVPPAEITRVPATATAPPTEAYIKIDEPMQGAVLDIANPVGVMGTGAGLPEGNVVVQALDRDGKVLAEKATILQGPNVGLGGEGTWHVELTIETQPGMAGRIVAFSKSPLDNSTIAEDSVEVSLGSTSAVKAYVKISEPSRGAVLDINQPVTIRGSGAGLPEGNLVVQALDLSENLLIAVPTTLQGKDVGVGGEGTWQVQLTVPAEPGTAGLIVALARSPLDNSKIAEDWIEVTFGRMPAVPAFLEIDEPADGAILNTDDPVTVSGTGGGLPEGTVIVQAVDANGKTLAEQATSLEGEGIGTGGEGTWSVELIVQPSLGTPGQIVVFSPDPESGDSLASDAVNVTYGEKVPSLEGTTWILDGTIAGTEITAVFDGRQVSGSGGCNTYTGTYVTQGDAITISNLTSTNLTCDEDTTDQEARYLDSLEAATRYAIQDDELTIRYSGGRLVYYGQ